MIMIFTDHCARVDLVVVVVWGHSIAPPDCRVGRGGGEGRQGAADCVLCGCSSRWGGMYGGPLHLGNYAAAAKVQQLCTAVLGPHWGGGWGHTLKSLYHVTQQCSLVSQTARLIIFTAWGPYRVTTCPSPGPPPSNLYCARLRSVLWRSPRAWLRLLSDVRRALCRSPRSLPAGSLQAQRGRSGGGAFSADVLSCWGWSTGAPLSDQAKGWDGSSLSLVSYPSCPGGWCRGGRERWGTTMGGACQKW